ncbi:uncharacterized protein LOC113146649 [Cyclospora cayetanensis]|uniref:Uncharacterized protein LOC113146649 n=1 Tax=Cyclospora cayetanensis TaxID=88456 RepID=A0A6P6RTK4_9EIME|nr:uncharacterized protein LOC113146649 [Cyclospora cayetanensis]
MNAPHSLHASSIKAITYPETCDSTGHLLDRRSTNTAHPTGKVALSHRLCKPAAKSRACTMSHGKLPLTTTSRELSSTASINAAIDYVNKDTTGLLLPLTGLNTAFARLYIFDWDNTLCPTDWLCELYSSFGQSVYTAKRPCAALYSPATRARMAALESSVRLLLQKCRERGQVAIVSNATSIGLLKTLMLLPTVQKTLTELQVQIVSARDMCEPHGLPLEKWKDTALIRLVTAFIHKRPKQKYSIMTIGDQQLEHIALHNAAAYLLRNRGWECHPKCIKYLENPSLETLTLQTLSLTDLLDRFADEESGTYWMQCDELSSFPPSLQVY